MHSMIMEVKIMEMITMGDLADLMGVKECFIGKNVVWFTQNFPKVEPTKKPVKKTK